ncbi:MAG: phosphoglucosamine mutase, partial [Cyanobacteria bacterium]|nr:phosphoglucosamine mutase [Cyanobacteriota bacterium]
MVGSSVRSASPSTALEQSIPSPWGTVQLPASPLFGTDGIRGQAGQLLTAPLAMQVGYWAGQILRDLSATDGPVLVGQDSRNSGHMLASALAAGLTSAGLE